MKEKVEQEQKRSFSVILFLIILLVIGFCWRVYSLKNNYSLWTDENTVAIFTRAILERGKPVLTNGYFTNDQQLQYWLNSISAKVLGLNEFGIRFPSVLFGTLTILAVYLLGSRLFNRKVGYFASLLTTFLKIEILWSRQARPYQALQFFSILGFYFIYRVAKENKFNWRCFLGFLGCGIFASLMHGLGLVVFFSGFVYLLIFKTFWLKKKWMLLGILLFVLFGLIFKIQIFSVFSQIGKVNNFYYYRVFLTHNYLLLCLLAILGGFLLFWRKNYRELLIFVISLGVQFIIVSFFLGQPFTRYFYPVFPFIILLVSFGIWETGNLISKKLCNAKRSRSNFQYLISFIFIFIIFYSLWRSDKLSLFPQKIYSLNSDMQEVPEVDWKKIYGFVDKKLKENPEAVLMTNWNDLPVWYLGEGRLNYLVRNETAKKDIFSEAYLINTLEKFVNLQKIHNKGIFVFDSWDNIVPNDIREYCHKNLKRELEIDRIYSFQPRYWTVWVYSWGLIEI